MSENAKKNYVKDFYINHFHVFHTIGYYALLLLINCYYDYLFFKIKVTRKYFYVYLLQPSTIVLV